MRINKNYDIGKLAEELKEGVNDSKKCNGNGVVRLDIIIANDILDVLEETQRREQKHQTLESALTFIEKEDGTQTNEMEYHNRAEETIKRNVASCVINPEKILPAEEIETKSEQLPECIGRYNGTDCKCLNCYANVECNNMYIERTSSIEKRTPSCFKHFYDNCKQCDNDECIHREECRKATQKEKPICFGKFFGYSEENKIVCKVKTCNYKTECRENSRNE